MQWGLLASNYSDHEKTNIIYLYFGSLLFSRSGLFSNLTKSMKTENMIRSGFTLRQIYVLEKLTEKPLERMSELKTDFLSHVNITEVIDFLEIKKGFVKRKRDLPDRRSISLEITEKGKAFMAKLTE